MHSSEPDRPLAQVIVEVAPPHLDHPFDYRVPDGLTLQVGQRVLVPFGGRRCRGLVVGFTRQAQVDDSRLRDVVRALGEHRWVTGSDLEVLRWAAGRFGAPLADVVRHALPARVVAVERIAADAGWLSDAPDTTTPTNVGEAIAGATTGPAAGTVLDDYGPAGADLARAASAGSGSFFLRPLPGAVLADLVGALVASARGAGRGAVVIFPDRSSPTAERLLEVLGDECADLRGGRSPRVHYREWLRARMGRAPVVIGERGAAFAPVTRLGLTVLVDEANPAHKERRSPRHHAREVLLERARRAGGAGVVIGTVPSAAAWRLLVDRRLTPVVASRATERRRRPNVQVAEDRCGPRARLARAAIAALREASDVGAYGVVLASRRGEGSHLVCRGCGERVACPRCESSLGWRGTSLLCDGCGWTAERTPRCEACRGIESVPLAAGTERLATELRRAVPGAVEVLEGYAPQLPPPPATLVMTRGAVLDAPPGPVHTVVLPDLERMLLRPELEAAEDALRLSMAVAGWTATAGASPTGTVVVQARDPDHHAVSALQRWNPGAFWRTEAALRAPLQFPPSGWLVRVDAPTRADDMMGAVCEAVAPAVVIGPVIEGERQRMLVKTLDRGSTVAALVILRDRLSRDGVDLRIDVDPVDAK